MKKILTILLMVAFGLSLQAQNNKVTSWKEALKTKSATLSVYYFDNHPFTYSDKGGVSGIEADIVRAFKDWCKTAKDVDVDLNFHDVDHFEGFYNEVKQADNGVVGLGSVAITPKRKAELKFTPPYIKNNSVLVSNITVPTLHSFKDFPKVLNGMTALVVKGSSHEKELLEIKQNQFPKLRVKYVETPQGILQMIFEDKQYFGYVDMLSYWSFVQKRCCVMKIHRDVSLAPEFFGFIMPQKSDWGIAFTEFFEGGFGFTATEEYQQILETYLGYEVIESVELY